MSAFSGSERGNETEKCFFFLFFFQNRAGGRRTRDSTVFAWPYKGFCNCCLLWFEDPPQWAEGKPLFSLINSMRWLDGSMHTAFGVQFSSPYQLALTTSTNCKANKNTALCIDLHTPPPAAGRWRGGCRAPTPNSPTTILSPLDWIRSLKIYGRRPLSSFYALFFLLLRSMRQIFCWSCWPRLKTKKQKKNKKHCDAHVSHEFLERRCSDYSPVVKIQTNHRGNQSTASGATSREMF